LNTAINQAQNTSTLSVYFAFNESVLYPLSINKIDSFLKNKIIQQISLQGHTDSVGSNQYNDELSTRRVLEVKKQLISSGVNNKKIIIKALGKRVALNANQTEHERALNRRVELVMTYSIPPKPKPVDPNLTEITISGTVIDGTNNGIKAEVSLNDKAGNELQVVKTDKNGNYQLKALLNKKDFYTLIYYNDSTFIGSKKISVTNQQFPFSNLTTVLPKLKGGGKYILENFNFVGDTSQLLSASLPSLQALYKLMKKNKNLVIQIEGHVNYPNYLPDPKTKPVSSYYHYPSHLKYHFEFSQWLSDERAKTVFEYLENKGIDTDRMSTVGFGASKMLYPNAVSEFEQEKNRRVEINVITY
jgi:outer membrane protein OmpA-like peptidoglycan-associated protein